MKIVGSYTDPQCFAFLMTPVADYNLFTYLQNVKLVQSPALRTFFGCLTNAIAYLHSVRIQHMDIKPENILIKDGIIYVADFGAANDWSTKERSTTWAAAPRTPRYMPPEIARDPHAPRNYATDMWSLGVVFLEMMTVLRGQSIKNFRQHLTGQGTKHQYVYANAPATRSWFEVLRQNDGPDYDNEPLTWIKDMIEADPLNRPTAVALSKQVLGSTSYTQFCCFSCTYHTEIRNQPFPNPYDEYASEDLQDCLSEIEYNESWNQNMPDGDRIPDALAHASESYSIESWLGVESSQEFEDDPSTTEFSGVSYDVESDSSTEIAALRTTVLSDQMSRRLLNFNFVETGTHQPSIETLQGKGDEILEEAALYDVVSDVSESDNSECTVRPLDLPDGLSFEDELDGDPPVSPLLNELATNYLENISTHSSLMDGNALDDVCEIPSRSPYASESPISYQAIEHASGEIFNNPRLEALSCVPPEEKVEETPTLLEFLSQKTVNTPRLGPNTSLESTLSSTLKQARPSTLVENTVNQGTLDILKKPEVVKERPRFIDYRPEVTAPLTLENLEKLPNAKKSTNSAVDEEVERTFEKEPHAAPDNKMRPAIETKATRIPKLFRRPAPTVSAKTYMEEVYQAESSAATSVISRRTKSKLSGGNLGYLDKTYKYLSYSAKEGSAAAVNRCLEMKCNPGTKVRLCQIISRVTILNYARLIRGLSPYSTLSAAELKSIPSVSELCLLTMQM